MNDTMESALDSEDLEEESEEQVDKILMEIAGETLGQMAAAPRQKMVSGALCTRVGGRECRVRQQEEGSISACDRRGSCPETEALCRHAASISGFVP